MNEGESGLPRPEDVGTTRRTTVFALRAARRNRSGLRLRFEREGGVPGP